MASPQPPVAIASGSCSVIYNNTLYVYSADAFQSLSLKTNGTWSQLKNGVSVDQAVCVQGTSATGGDSLWVVGGTTTNETVSDYTGIQHYSFDSQSWETLSPAVTVTKDRINHAAVFLPASSAILVYSGSQKRPVVPSSDTFLISVLPPYNTEAFATGDLPSTSPLLLNWSNDSAITIGGNGADASIFRFDTDNGWRNISTRLTSPLASTDNVQATLVEGSDNSKVLELYDLASTPVTVSQLVLQHANGTLASTGTTLASLSADSKRKRDLTLADWPTYNATNAPTAARSDYSTAVGAGGLVAFVGGNAQSPLALFDQNTNAWIDTGRFFGASATATSGGVTASSSTPSSSSSASSASTAAAVASSSNNHPKTSLILGATLGSILGLIALLLILLLLLRWHRKRKAEAAREEKDGQRLSFADRGDPDMVEAGGAVSHLNNGQSEKPSTPGSGAWLGASTRPRSGTLRSESSRTQLISPQRGDYGTNLAANPVPELQRPQAARTNPGVPSIIPEVDSRPNSTFLTLPIAAAAETRSSAGSGWSGYFTHNTKPVVIRAPSAAVINPAERSNLTPRNSILAPLFQRSKSKRDTLLNYEQMVPDNHDCATHGPVDIPPVSLAPEFEASRVSQDVTNTPTSKTAGVAQIAGGLRPGTSSTAPGSRHGHSRTLSSAGSTNNGSSVFTHDPIEQDGHWTPVTRNDWSTPDPVRRTVASSYYGGEEPNSDSSDPDGAVPSPSLMPGGKDGNNGWTGMASPKMPISEVLGHESPTPKARVMSASRATPVPVLKGKYDRPHFGSVEGSPNPMVSTKEHATDNMDWLRLPVKST